MVQQDDWFFGGDGSGADAGGRADGGDRPDAATAVASAPGGEEGPPERASRGRRRGLVAAGATAAVALGLAGAGAVVVTGLGGPDVVLARAAAPATDAGAPGSPGEPGGGADDAYLAALTAPTETPPPPPPEPVDVPEPVVRVVPLAPGESYGEDADPHAVAYEVPDLGASWSAALPDGQVVLGDLGQYRLQPTVPGQSCNGPHPDAVAGRQWMWAEEASNRLDQTTVGLVVTGWPDGDAAFNDVVEDDGPCTWYDDVPSPADVVVPSADEAWAGVRRSPVGDRSTVLLGAARTGDLVVGVEVWNPPAGASADLTGRLLEAAVLELRAADPGGAAR